MRTSRLAGVGIFVTAAAIALPLSVSTSAAAEPAPAPVVAEPAPATKPVVPTKRPLTRAQVAAAKRARMIRARAMHDRWVRKVRYRVVQQALSRVHGGRYVAGASSPWAFDCSGFTKYVYRAATGITLPHYSGAQLHYSRGHRVGLGNLMPGDLMAWGSNGSQHVSIYIGRGMMIGANNPSRDVVIEPINSSYWAPRFAGARRVIV